MGTLFDTTQGLRRAVNIQDRITAPTTQEQLDIEQAQAIHNQTGAIQRGFNSGLRGAAGQLHGLAGGVAEAVGANEFAQGQYDASKLAQQEAAILGPDITSYKQVDGVGTGLRYVGGLVGSSAPVMAAGLTAAALTKGQGLRPLAAATAATMPFEAGNAIQRQQNDPEALKRGAGERLAVGLGTGAASAALQNLVPLAVTGQLARGAVGQAARTSNGIIAKNAAIGVGGEAAAESGAELLQQQAHGYLNPNRDTSGDAQALREAAVGGAAVGGPLAGVGMVRESMSAKLANRGKAPLDPMQRSTEVEKQEGVDLGPDSSFTTMVGGLGSFLRPEPTTAEEHANLNLTIDDTPATVKAKDEQGSTAAAQKAHDTLTKLWNDPSAAHFQEELGKIDTFSSEGQTRIRDINVQHFESRQAAKNIKAANDALDALAAKDLPDVHFSKDTSGADTRIFEMMDSPEWSYLGDDTKKEAAALTRRFITVGEQTGDAPSIAIRELTGVMGKQAVSKLSEIYDAMGSKDPAKREAFYKALAKVSSIQKSDDSLLATVRSALPDHMIDSVRSSQLKEFVSQMKDLTGEQMFKNMTPSEQRIKKSQIDDKLQEVFGEKADQINEAFAKHALEEARNIGTTPPDRTSSAGAQADTAAEYDGKDVADASHDSGITPIEQEAPRFYGGGKGKFDEKNPQFIQHRDVHRADPTRANSESAHERLTRRAENENPGRSVDFISAKDYAKEHGIDDATLNKLTNGKPEQHGLIIAEGTKDASRIDWKEFEQMQGQRDKNGELKSSTYDSDTRIDTIAGPIDAMQVIKTMRRKLGYTSEDDRSGSMYRLARMFHEGIAMISEQVGEAVHVGDTIVVAKYNGKEVTYKDIKNVKAESSDPSWMKGKSDEQINKEIDRRDALRDASTDELRRWTKQAHSVFEKRDAALQAHLSTLPERGTKLKSVEMNTLRKKFGVSEADKAIAAIDREMETRDKGTTRERMMDSGDRSEVDPHGNAVEAAAMLKAEDLKRKQGYDDNQIRHDKVNKTDFDAVSPDRRAALNSKVNSLEANAKGKVQQSIAKAARALTDRFDQLTKTHQGELAKIAVSKKWSDVASTVESLTDKYKTILGNAPVKVAKDQFSSTAGEGGDQHAAIVARVAKSNDPKALQESVMILLKDRRPNEHKQAIIAAMNDRISALIEKNPDAAYLLMTKGNERNSKAEVDQTKGSTAAQQKAVIDYINKVTNSSVDVNAAAKLLYAGNYIEGGANHRPAINVSVHALDPTSVAYHESLHWLVDDLRKNGDPDTIAALAKVADSAYVRNFLRSKFKDLPAARKQVEDSMEERVAYMYQFWANGDLTLGTKGHSLLDRIGNYIKSVFGIWTNDQRAQHIMEFFHSGEYAKSMGDRGAVYKHMMEQGRNKTIDHLRGAVEPLAKLGEAVAGIGSARVRDTNIPAFNQIADLMRKHGTKEGDDAGFITAAGVKAREVGNIMMKNLGKFTEVEVNAAFANLQTKKPPQTVAQGEAMKAMRSMLDGMYTYMREAKVDVGDLGYGRDYLPNQWDPGYIATHQAEFKTMIEKYVAAGQYAGSSEALLSRLMRNDGAEIGIEGPGKPGNQHIKERILKFISPEDAAPFLEKDAMRVLHGYIKQGTKRAEWARRFGDDSAKLEDMKKAAVKYGATPEQMALLDRYVQGVNGQLGSDVSPETRKLFGQVMVYQNLRLLPLGFFSSLIDPIGVAVRGGSAKDVFQGFSKAFSEIPRGFKKTPKYDERYEFAEDMNVIETAALQHVLGASYGMNTVGNTARKVNETLFKYNLMEQMNTTQRVVATQAAVGFIRKHASGDFNMHSLRYLAELGLTPKDIIMVDGRPAMRQADFEKAGQTPEAAQKSFLKMSQAVNQWVDGAVLRPDQSQKAIWMNDAHFVLVAHMKQFAFAFQDTILKRIVHEAKHGNYTPAAAMASYIPVMLTADLLKGLIQGGGEQPEWKKGWDMGDYLASATQRSGLFGVGQYGIDAFKEIRQGSTGLGALGGPTINQLGEVVSTVGGSRQFSSTFVDSMPANALWSGYLPTSTTSIKGESGDARGGGNMIERVELNTAD